MYCLIVDPRKSGDMTNLHNAIVGISPVASVATVDGGESESMKACKKRKRQRPTPSRLFTGK